MALRELEREFALSAHSPAFLTLKRMVGNREVEDFCVPVNPYFPTPGLWSALRAEFEEILRYYPATGDDLYEVASRFIGVPAQNLVLGNGSTELIAWICQLHGAGGVVTPVPTFGRWTDHPRELKHPIYPFATHERDDFHLDVAEFVSFAQNSGARCAVLCNPNNPTGDLLTSAEIESLCDGVHDFDLIVIDESFLDFADEPARHSAIPLALARPNVVVLKSLGKSMGLHGVRMGFLVGTHPLISNLRRSLPLWNVNAVAEFLFRQLPQYSSAYYRSLRQVVADRRRLLSDLSELEPVTVFPSQANFVYAKLGPNVDGLAVRDRLLAEHSILLRECGNKIGASPQFFRIAARPPLSTSRLLCALTDVINGKRERPGREAGESAAPTSLSLLHGRPQSP